MSKKQYDPKMITSNLYGDRRPVKGKIVAILHISFKNRSLNLIDSKSRVLPQGDIHELMITDETTAGPGFKADRVTVIGFFEVNQGGLIVTGDVVKLGDRRLGELVGFDVTHMPNHMNVVVRSQSLDEPLAIVGDEIVFNKP